MYSAKPAGNCGLWSIQEGIPLIQECGDSMLVQPWGCRSILILQHPFFSGYNAKQGWQNLQFPRIGNIHLFLNSNIRVQISFLLKAPLNTFWTFQNQFIATEGTYYSKCISKYTSLSGETIVLFTRNRYSFLHSKWLVLLSYPPQHC
jgi:hypothetical protein